MSELQAFVKRSTLESVDRARNEGFMGERDRRAFGAGDVLIPSLHVSKWVTLLRRPDAG